jgi:hypothetical protein
MHELSDEEYEAATARGKILLETEPHATAARYDRSAGVLVIDLEAGSSLEVKVSLLQDLEGASPADLGEIEIHGQGSNLHWPRLNADLYVPSLAKGIYGTRAWMSRLSDRTTE